MSLSAGALALCSSADGAHASSSGIGLESRIGESIFNSSAASDMAFVDVARRFAVGGSARDRSSVARRLVLRRSVGASRGRRASHARVVRSRRSSRALGRRET